MSMTPQEIVHELDQHIIGRALRPGVDQLDPIHRARRRVRLGLAIAATLLSIRLRIATALSEIVVGTVAQLLLGVFLAASLGADQPWIKFLSGTGAIVLTFLAGAEIDPDVFRQRWKEASVIGLISFAAPFLGCTAAAQRAGCRRRAAGAELHRAGEGGKVAPRSLFARCIKFRRRPGASLLANQLGCPP